MSKIKFNPRKKGYWENKPVAIESENGKIYTADAENKTEITAVQGDYRPLMVDIIDCGDFLSLKLYGLNQRINKITDYKKDPESLKKLKLMPVGIAYYNYNLEYCQKQLEKKPNQILYGLVNYKCYNWNSSGYIIHSKTIDEIQLRIYKDYKVVLIQKIETPEGKEIYFVDKNHDYPSIITIKLKTSGQEIKKQLNKIEKIKIIKSEEEVYPLASKLTKEDCSNLLQYFFTRQSIDSRKKFLTASNCWDYDRFTEETNEIINNFFDYQDGEDPRLLIRKKIYLKDWYNNGAGITSIRSLFRWITISETSFNRRISLQQRINQILENTGLDSVLEKIETNKKKTYWAKTGDDIICLVPSNLSSMLIYNVKTKKRTFAQYRKGDKTWIFPIPSIKLITSNMQLDCRRDDDDYTYIIPETVILGNLTVKELFAETNIEWILNNVNEEDCKVFNYQSPYCFKDRSATYQSFLNEKIRGKMIIPITNYFQQNRIGTFALAILVSTGNIMLEQLLKAKLFNLYFAIIESQIERNRRSSEYYNDYTITFLDLDSKKYKGVTYRELMEDTDYRYNCRYTNFIIHSKGKNLKEIFNLPISFLRIINEQMKIVEDELIEKGNDYIEKKLYKWHRVQYTCNIISYIFPELKNIDPKNMHRIADLCKEEKINRSDYYYNYRRDSTAMIDGGNFLFIAFGEDLSKISLQQKLKFIEASSHYRYQTFKDYLNMRKQLKEKQDNHPEKVGIFSEKNFPMLPTATTRFIRYFEGMQLGWQRASSEEEFLHYYYSKYCKYSDPKKYQKDVLNNPIKIITSPITKEVIGISLDFTGNGFLDYLHDEASYWISVYQDEEKSKQFIEAVKRVQPLEWKDPDSNLCIIAPKNIGDIKEEGATLHHCVSSYIDPIINGTENIMLLRRMDMPNHPFYTVEILNNGEIRQVHCFQNGDLTTQGQEKAHNNSRYEVYNKQFDIYKFLQKWAKAFKGKINAASIKLQYGALCAIQR